MSVDKVESSTHGVDHDCVGRNISTASSVPKSDPMPIPQRSNAESYFRNGSVIKRDREDEEYEQLKQLYSYRTWIMFHRIQVHRKQQEAKKMANTSMAPKIAIPGYITSPEPTPLISLVPALRVLDTHRNDDFYNENRDQAFSDEDLIFGDLED